MSKINIILTCSSNKKLEAPPFLSLKNYKKENVKKLSKSWMDNIINNSSSTLPAIKMYKGVYWEVVKKLYNNPKVNKIWVISAGYGLINVNDNISSYNIGFKDKSLNSIKLNTLNPSKNVFSEWWDNITNITQNKIFQLYDPNEIYIIYASYDYMKAIKNDISKIVSKPNIFIVSPDTKIKQFKPYILYTPSNLRYILGGNKMTSSIKVVEYLVNNFDEFNHNKINNHFKCLLNQANIPPQIRAKRKKIGDEEMIKYIKEIGINSPFTSIFNFIRDKGIAAGEARIIRLIHALKQNNG